jgi:molybdenum cofactor biosynthesis protein B
VSHQAHRAAAPASVTCAVITVSDTRTEETDTSGGAIAALLEAGGHRVASRVLVRDEPAQVEAAVRQMAADRGLQAIILTGGTGISRRDGTYEAVSRLLEKRLDGFGELFRMLSFQEIGPAAMLSRAFAGTMQGRIVVALPGSEHAVRLAMTKLLLPELGHLVREVNR